MVSDKAFADAPMDARLAYIKEAMHDSDKCEQHKPGNHDIYTLLKDYLGTGQQVQPEDFLRRVLLAYKNIESDDAYSQVVKGKLTEDERTCLEKFVVHGASAKQVGEHFKLHHSIGVREEVQHFHKHNQPISKNGRTSVVEVDSASSFGSNEAITKSTYDCTGLGMRAAILITGIVVKIKAYMAMISQEPIHGLHDAEFGAWNDTVKIYGSQEFVNWGQTVKLRPNYTFWPRNVQGVINVVRFAKKKNLSVRCAGYRHSWSPIFGKEGHVILSMMNPEKVANLPDVTALPLADDTEPTELETTEILSGSKLPCAPGKSLVRVGAACTSERLRRWCIANKKVTLPMNVIMVEVTLGGSNAPICHGAGRRHHTLSDLVRCIEYVDCNGILQTVTDSKQLRAASGAFGLLGVVTHITMEFDAMSYAMLRPEKKALIRAVPPPDDMMARIPKALQSQIPSAEERQEDIAAFEKACAENYYAEWFWFPYADMAWVNTWNTTDDPTDVVDFPNAEQIFLQWAQTVLFNIAQYSSFLQGIGKTIGLEPTGCTIISRAAMFSLGETPVKTYVTDGLHFQRAVQNVRVRDCELEIPIPAVKAASAIEHARPDWSIARRAWWDAIITAYDHFDTQPQRMPLEMRITGDSNVILAPQRGNTLGTCSIEVLTLESYSKPLNWNAYCQKVVDKWTSYTDANGKLLRVRPHWAKEWHELKCRGRPWREVLVEEYKEEVEEFKGVLADIGRAQGWTLEDVRHRFGNEWLEKLFFS